VEGAKVYDLALIKEASQMNTSRQRARYRTDFLSITLVVVILISS
jgi:hypothetical protein